jgi:hypothetical protein
VALPIYLRVAFPTSLVATAIRVDVALLLNILDPFLRWLASCGLAAASIPVSITMRITAAVRLASATALPALLRLLAVMGFCEGGSGDDKT